jgi:predicted amidohydrolase
MSMRASGEHSFNIALARFWSFNMAEKEQIRVAAVQAAPVFYDLDASVDKAVGLIRQAAEKGCDLVAFGEAWLPGYPFHIWLGSPAWSLKYTQTYYENSLQLGSPQYHRLSEAARDNRIHVAVGYSERHEGSLYLGQCLIDDEGELVAARRKLKPTHAERTVFGEGYGNDLIVPDTKLGKVGSLCCWEHMQPLSKFALYSQSEEIHIAAWPSFALYRDGAYALGIEVNMAATRVYAVEGQCFVVAASSVVDQRTLDILEIGPSDPPLLQLGGGSSMIFGPDGRALAEFLPETDEGLVVADINKAEIIMAKAIADPAGHYAKPEVTRLHLDLRPKSAVIKIEDDAAPDGAGTSGLQVGDVG